MSYCIILKETQSFIQLVLYNTFLMHIIHFTGYNVVPTYKSSDTMGEFIFKSDREIDLPIC